MELPLFGEVTHFWVGVMGSLSIEVTTCWRAMANADGDLPVRYKKPVYLIVRGLLALGGGTLAVVFDAPTALAAFYLGASAPIVLDKLAQGAIPTMPVEPSKEMGELPSPKG